MQAATDGAQPLREDVTTSRDDKVRRTIELLKEALILTDSIGDCPEVGARLQGMIDTLQVDLGV